MHRHYRNPVIATTIAFLVLTATASAQPWPRILDSLRSDTDHIDFGWRIVRFGDQNGDGYADFLTWDRRNRICLFHGTPHASTGPVLAFDSMNAFFGNAGDLNGDGYNDLAGRGRNQGRNKLLVFHGGPSMDIRLDASLGYDSLHGAAPLAQGYDINGNGTTELITWAQTNLRVLFFEQGDSADTLPSMILWPANLKDEFRAFGWGLAVGDFNGDDTMDLAAHVRGVYTNEAGRVFCYWGGADFDTIPDAIIPRPGGYLDYGSEYFGEVLENVGDLNGDGYEDLVISTGASGWDTPTFVYFTGPTFDTLPDVTITVMATHAGWAGDLNTDGFHDLVLSYPTPYSGSGEVYVVLGGPEMDGEPDVTILNHDWPGLSREFGRAVTGIGDYNGDGHDDFAFSAEDVHFHGLVYILSGWEGTTGIADEPLDPVLPADFILDQNYPNPFNPSTTISFSLPRSSVITLRIRNPLGQTVTTLINSCRLSPGSHTITWDASAYASGPYLCELVYPTGKLSRKMLLLK